MRIVESNNVYTLTWISNDSFSIRNNSNKVQTFSVTCTEHKPLGDTSRPSSLSSYHVESILDSKSSDSITVLQHETVEVTHEKRSLRSHLWVRADISVDGAPSSHWIGGSYPNPLMESDREEPHEEYYLMVYDNDDNYRPAPHRVTTKCSPITIESFNNVFVIMNDSEDTVKLEYIVRRTDQYHESDFSEYLQYLNGDIEYFNGERYLPPKGKAEIRCVRTSDTIEVDIIINRVSVVTWHNSPYDEVPMVDDPNEPGEMMYDYTAKPGYK